MICPVDWLFFIRSICYFFSPQVINPADKSGLKIILFQYTTCPFCCKVRAFLDFYGFSYDIVEVDPVLRQQIKWSKYRKVPIVLIQRDDGSYLVSMRIFVDIVHIV